MRRKLFTLVSILSLLLCAGILPVRATVWWGHRPVIWTVNGAARADGTRPRYEIGCDGFGHVGAGSVRELPLPTSLVSMRWASSRPIFLARHWGFTVMWGENVSVVDYSRGGPPMRPSAKVVYDAQTHYVSAPCWAVAGCLLLMPLLWARSRHREFRTRRLLGCCRRCGYNLTGNISRICPECGTIIAPAAATA